MEALYSNYNFIFYKENLPSSTNKIIIPFHFFNEYISHYDIENDLKFILYKDNIEIIVGVYEFSETNIIYLPTWIQEYLNINDGDYVNIKFSNEKYEKGSKCIIQAQDVSFLNINDPCKVLENVFNNYTIIFKNQLIRFNYEEKDYFIKIIETSPSDKINIIDVDLNIDFIEPVGYKEYIEDLKKKEQQKLKDKIIFNNTKEITKKEETKKFVPFSGKGYSLKD